MLRWEHFSASGLGFAILLLVAVRPLAVALGLLRAERSRSQHGLISWFGVRGVGSLYYLTFAITHGLPAALVEQLTAVTLVAVALSIVFHGISVTPLMKLYEKTAH
jgi:NhaP-type Na+/H+ or K+/H+ antiporter